MSHKIIICPSCGAINKVDLEKRSGAPHCGKCQSSIALGPSLKTVSSDKLDKIIRHSKLPVVVDIYADWCGPCKMYAPVFEEVSRKNWQRAEFFKIDSEMNPEFSARYNVRGIPTTLVFQNGQLKTAQSGLLNQQQLESLI